MVRETPIVNCEGPTFVRFRRRSFLAREDPAREGAHEWPMSDPARNCPPLVDTQAAFDALLPELRDSPVLAVDAEMDSYYSYFQKLCLIQISTQRSDLLIDPLRGLNLSALGDIMQSPDQVKVFHAGENDIPYFRDLLGCGFAGLFDTHLAARVLGFPRCGLAPLLEEHFQVVLDKRFQTADWRLRPLPDDQAEYARTDTRYLLALRDILAQALVEADRVEEAESEFRRVGRATMSPKVFDPEGWVKLKGARTLPPAGRAVIRELYQWRDRLARSRDMAAFRVMPEALMLALAQKQPETKEELAALTRHRTVLGHREEVLALIARSRRQEAHPPKRRPQGEPMTRRQQKLYEKLREWRNAVSSERGVEPDRVFPNRLLKRIALAEPSTAEQLETLEGMETWRVRAYAEAVLELLGS